MKLLMTKKKKNISNQQSRSPQRTRFNFEISLQTSFVAYLTRKKMFARYNGTLLFIF